MKYLIIFTTLMLCVFNLNAQVDSTLLEMSLEDLMNIEITSVSKKAENVLKAPQTIVVITAKDIQQRGYTDLEQIMHDIPGFDISRGNGTQYSQVYQRGYRSNNTEKTLFLIDGVEENDLWSQSVWLSRQYPVSNIKRIEIIYGPASTVYGANAFLGVVNVITKDSKDYIKDGNTFGVSAQVGYGTWNTKFADVSLSKKFDNDISLSLTGRVFQSDEMDLSKYKDWDYSLDDYDLNYYLNKLGTTDNAVAQAAMNYDKDKYFNDPELNGKKPHFSNLTNDYLINGKLKIKDFTLGFQTYSRDEGYGGWYRDDYELGPDNGGRWVPKNTFLYAKYENQITDKLSITSFTRFKSHMLTSACEEYYYIGYLNGGLGVFDKTGALLPVDSLAQPYWYHAWYHTYSQQLRSEFKVNYQLTDKLDFVGGVEYRNSLIQGNYFVSTVKHPEDNSTSVKAPGGNYFYSRDIGAYLQASYKASEDLNIVLGGRLDNNKIRETGGYGTVFNPKVAIVYSPNDLIAKAMYSEAFMDASSWTKYGTTASRMLNNPTLKPERVKNTELSLGYSITKNLFAEVSAYYASYSDVVGIKRVPYLNDSTNQQQAIGSLEIMGLQSNIRYKFNNYTAYFNYSYTNPQNTSGDKDIRIGDIATHKFNFGVNAEYFKKLNINLRTNWVGEKPTGAETTISANQYDKIDSYFILNGAISYKFYKGFTAQVTANNILDLKYYDPGVRSANGDYYASRIPQNGRNIMVKIIAEF